MKHSDKIVQIACALLFIAVISVFFGCASQDPAVIASEVAQGWAADNVDEVAGNVADLVAKDNPLANMVATMAIEQEINALQSAATVVIQKSLREGFGLTISEALWKSKPVVAMAVGGIPLQINNKLTGLLCYSVEGAAFDLKQLLSNPEYAQWLGRNGREHVRENFLITSHLKDYMLMFVALDHTSDIIQF